MKRFAIVFLVSTVFLTLSLAAQKAQTFTGEIMDSQCALLGGHENMIQQGESSKQCANRCVMLGGKYVLFDSASKTAYQLDDQKKAGQFAGSKVKVTGTFDSASKTIHITDIKPGS